MRGITVLEHKEYTKDRPIREAKLPGRVYIPLSQHVGKPAQAIVKEGQEVKRGQLIAKASGFISSNIHSSVSGKVASIESFAHPVLGRSTCIVIDSDGRDEPDPSIRERAGTDNLSPGEIIEIVHDAGVVGLGGAAFPTHAKLSVPQTKKINYFILNGAECEPYLTGDYRLMIEKTTEILKGVELISRCVQAEKVYIAIEDNKPQAIEAFRKELKSSAYPYSLFVLKTRYPQGGEKQLIQTILNREVPPGGLPFDAGALVHNVATAFAIYKAVYKNEPLYERVITISSSLLENPSNLKVRIGTPLESLLGECGPLNGPVAKVIFGGPMMGIAQWSWQTPAIKSTSGIVLLSPFEADLPQESACIKCAKCVDVCPMNLVPTHLKRLVTQGYWDRLERYNVSDCIECGCCAYICPSRIPLVQYIKLGKLKRIQASRKA
jgi:electron transport complex protein RnfC